MRAQTRARSFRLLAGLVSDAAEVWPCSQAADFFVIQNLNGEGRTVFCLVIARDGPALSNRLYLTPMPTPARLAGLHS